MPSFLKSLGIFSTLGALSVTPLTIFSSRSSKTQQNSESVDKVPISENSEKLRRLINIFTTRTGTFLARNRNCTLFQDWIYSDISLLYRCDKESQYALYLKWENIGSIYKIKKEILGWVYKKDGLNGFWLAFIIA